MNELKWVNTAFTNKKIIHKTSILIINENTVKYLGVKLDANMCWKEQEKK